MKRLAILSLAIGAIIGFCAQANAQGCYGGSYQGNVGAPFGVESDTQEITVPVTVRVAVPRVSVSAVAPVAAPLPSCGNVGLSQSCQGSVGLPMAQSYSVVQPVAVAHFVYPQQTVAVSHHFVGVQRNVAVAHYGNVGGNFGAVGVVNGGSNIQARDRRGTVVNANFNNSVKIRRGVFGNIREVVTDANRGLFGRISPF